MKLLSSAIVCSTALTSSVSALKLKAGVAPVAPTAWPTHLQAAPTVDDDAWPTAWESLKHRTRVESLNQRKIPLSPLSPEGKNKEREQIKQAQEQHLRRVHKELLFSVRGDADQRAALISEKDAQSEVKRATAEQEGGNDDHAARFFLRGNKGGLVVKKGGLVGSPTSIMHGAGKADSFDESLIPVGARTWHVESDDVIRPPTPPSSAGSSRASSPLVAPAAAPISIIYGRPQRVYPMDADKW